MLAEHHPETSQPNCSGFLSHGSELGLLLHVPFILATICTLVALGQTVVALQIGGLLTSFPLAAGTPFVITLGLLGSSSRLIPSP